MAVAGWSPPTAELAPTGCAISAQGGRHPYSRPSPASGYRRGAVPSGSRDRTQGSVGARPASPVRGFILRRTLEVAPDASLDDFIDEARRHPVFELRSRPEASS